MGQAANVRTARGSFEVRTANPKRFEPLASRYVSNSRYLLCFNADNYYTYKYCMGQLAGARDSVVVACDAIVTAMKAVLRSLAAQAAHNTPAFRW